MSLEDALQEADAANEAGELCYQDIADNYGITRSTLSRQHRGVVASRDDADLANRKLSPQQERELCEYIEVLTKRHLPPTRQMVQNFAIEMAQEWVSDSWVTRFLDRHKDTLLYKWASAIDAQRHYADSSDKYTQYFELLHATIEKYSIEPRHTYNMDEKGFAIGLVGRSKRVFTRSTYEKKRNQQSLQDGNSEWVTVLASVCADGTALPPGLIYAGKSNTIQSSWVEDIEPGKHSVFVSASPTGWTNDELGLAWLEQVFDRSTKSKTRRSWRLLIVDGHNSHVTRRFIDYCDSHQILLLIFPPHSTHTLQPLDVVCFAPLASNYDKEVTEHLHDSQALASIKKSDFFRLFNASWANTFTKDLVLQSFKATGISPPNPHVILD